VSSANDGIVSTAGLVAGATAARGPTLTAGVAGMVAGAVSMALREYVSMSSQPDTERALLYEERADLARSPAAELDELAAIYVAKGARVATARRLAEESTAKDALAAHVDAEPASIQGRSPEWSVRGRRSARPGCGWCWAVVSWWQSPTPPDGWSAQRACGRRRGAA
jgi:VIT1/CCC1 family predicted Fe2+/Mn2+ transporter